MSAASSSSGRIEISAPSMLVFQSLLHQPMVAPFVVTALRGIQNDRYGYGRPLTHGRFHFQPIRAAVVALPGDKQLWLYWNPDLTPTTVVTLAVLARPDPSPTAG